VRAIPHPAAPPPPPPPVPRPPSPPLQSAVARPHRPVRSVRQPIVSAAIVIYRPDDLWFRLHRSRRRYRTVPGRPELSGDSSARDRSYILIDDSPAVLSFARRILMHHPLTSACRIILAGTASTSENRKACLSILISRM
jgi:hypothetical protein